MLLRIAMVISENQMSLKELNLATNTIESKIIDTISIPEQNLNLLFLDETDDLTSLTNTIEKENKFYPIALLQSLELDKDAFEMLDAESLQALYNKVTNRWILNNNVKTIEQLYPTITYLKDMWIKDRNSFFEELWFIVKTNIASTELNIIFHDLKEPTVKQEEKGEKPKLCYSYVQGEKIPNLFEGKDKEALLMKEYDGDFNDFFNITEYSKEKHQFTACAKIGLSPVLIMAKMPNFNQLQQSILIALFTGLQD